MKRPLPIAMQAARKAGKMLLGLRNVKEKGRKGNKFDLVTEGDLQSEKIILSLLRKEFPEHNFITEESIQPSFPSPYRWYIDPVDGTRNFFHGFPFWSVSIALYREETPLLGVVYDPNRDELFTAEKGKPARLNGKRIRVSRTTRLHEFLGSTGFPYVRRKTMPLVLKNLGFAMKKIGGIVRSGSAALDLCYVACGRVDLFWEFSLKPWDTGAGTLIARRAGAKITNEVRKEWHAGDYFLLASNNKHHSFFQRLFQAK